MSFSSTIIKDSIGEFSPRLTTYELRYPRMIHAEVMTHREFSRNASSSRAIPVERMIEDVIRDPAMPVYWGRNKRGMQAVEEISSLVRIPSGALVTPEKAWLNARDAAVEYAMAFKDAEYHKQIVNRLLEPFGHINVVLSTTNMSNFFWLRRHKDAMPEIIVLANMMWSEYKNSNPDFLKVGKWHLPYIVEEDTIEFVNGGNGTVIEHLTPLADLLKVSTARSARVSYKTFEGKKPDFHADLTLYSKLVESDRLHASPAEHQAKVDTFKTHTEMYNGAKVVPTFLNKEFSGNFAPGWVQYRKTLPGEYCDNYVED